MSTNVKEREEKKKYTQNMCVYIKIASHFRLSIECLEIKNKCRQRNTNYQVKSFKQVRIEKYITPLAGSILTNRSRVWPVNVFINTSKVSGCQRIVNTAVKCHISAEISLDYFISAVWGWK